jgi:hypothetical protein
MEWLWTQLWIAPFGTCGAPFPGAVLVWRVSECFDENAMAQLQKSVGELGIGYGGLRDEGRILTTPT